MNKKNHPRSRFGGFRFDDNLLLTIDTKTVKISTDAIKMKNKIIIKKETLIIINSSN